MGETFSLAQIATKMDWEGWPAVLEWFNDEEIEDKEFSQLWYDAQQAYGILEGYYNQILRYFNDHEVEVD